LEAGFLSAFCCAPWVVRTKFNYLSRATKVSTAKEIDNEAHFTLWATQAWPLRFLLFKLMFMSGVVKIQSNCPTWLNLTALEYHFATQCLPSPLSWYLHQLHPFILRLSVAMALFIEIPASFLLLAPNITWRRIGAILQILLQVMIMLSGNYNFFNLLTVLLCLPCLGVLSTTTTISNTVTTRMDEENNDVETINKTIFYQKLFEIGTCVAFLIWCFIHMFEIESISTIGSNRDDMNLNIRLSISKHELEDMIYGLVPATIGFSFCASIWTGIHGMISRKEKRFRSLCHLIVCTFCIGITSVPLTTLSQDLSQTPFMTPSHMFMKPYQLLQPYGVSNSYGLFRQMTGVGDSSKFDQEVNWGWTELPPSIVERPEIILEGFFIKEEKWRELNFRWKPGDVMKRPKQVAPHQPRLDWQMWFAALQPDRHPSWIVHFIDKLLRGCSPVTSLLDEPTLEQGKDHISKIRLKLYSYDFTRVNTEWSKLIPGTVQIPNWTTREQSSPWWVRTYRGEYLSTMEVGDPRLASFLSSNRYALHTCEVDDNNVDQISSLYPFQILYHILKVVRQRGFIWLIPVICLFITLRTSCSMAKKNTREKLKLI